MMKTEETKTKTTKRIEIRKIEQNAEKEQEKEYENKIHKHALIALLLAGLAAIVLMIVEGSLGHFSSLFAIGFVAFFWTSLFYFFQYNSGRRSGGVLLGAILELIGAAYMLTFYILFNVGVF
ncbi:MAG: hypothetical protein IJ837_01425 [Clostridia bacterium]|nr:hypothetical protein [Clostridia bacterium]